MTCIQATEFLYSLSAFVHYAARLAEAEDIALDYLQWVFSRSEPDPEADSKSVPDGERRKANSPTH
jgi:hypothetical protein